MTSTLTVIALITRMRITSHTTTGDALYREKITNQTYTFGFKQFTNARHDYNEAFREGDLVLLSGKFTLDNEKLMVNNTVFFFYNDIFYNNIKTKLILTFFAYG